jgi:glycosyltransferase involved in cell wall biosynthesis
MRRARDGARSYAKRRKAYTVDQACEASVVVCTRNRRGLLEQNIEALLAQRHPSFEIIYADDGSTDDTPRFLDAAQARRPGLIRVVRTNHRGPGPARNAGAAIARGKYLLFIDDDATAPPGWIAEMLSLRDRRGCAVLCGGIEPFSMESPVERYLHYRMMTALGHNPHELKSAPTGNLLIDRAAFDAAGGFRDLFLPAAEDWDLSYRLRRQGARIFYDPAAAVVHRYSPDRARAEQAIATTGAAGVYVARLEGRSPAAYTAYALLRFAASPVLAAQRYPRDLYWLALRMEWLFARSRVRAYVRMLLGKPVFQEPSASE